MVRILKYWQVWLSVFVGCLLTPALFLLAALLSGGGHSLDSVIIVFPYSMLLGLAFERVGRIPGMMLLAVQYPVYGLILGLAKRNGVFLICFLSLLVLHVIAAMACLTLYRIK